MAIRKLSELANSGYSVVKRSSFIIYGIKRNLRMRCMVSEFDKVFSGKVKLSVANKPLFEINRLKLSRSRMFGNPFTMYCSRIRKISEYEDD